jgi:tRNA(Arg) A34 adenosine deaminase TadA
MCTAVAIWARMDGIVFGASQEDAADFARDREGDDLTWRQIRITAADVAAAGEPTLWVRGGVHRSECLRLFALGG